MPISVKRPQLIHISESNVEIVRRLDDGTTAMLVMVAD